MNWWLHPVRFEENPAFLLKKTENFAEDTPVLVTEPAMVQPRKAKREKIFELLFERFRVPGAYLAAGELLSLFSLGRETGMVVDVGYDFSRVVPAYECYTLPHATRICENGV